MFEQSIYEVDPPAPPLEEGDIFHGYEVKTWEWSPRFFKLAAVVAVVNILLLVGTAQTSLLTRKGCDSPFVGRVCQVLDTIYVGNILLGSEREYVDQAYDPTTLQPDDEITFVDVGGDNAPLYYPAGYFDNSDPNPLPPGADPTMPGGSPTFSPPAFPTSPDFPRPSMGKDLTATKPNYPKPNKNPVSGDLPTGFDDEPSSVANKRPKGKNGKSDGDNTVAVGPCNEKGEIPGIPGSSCKQPANGQNGDPTTEAQPDQFGIFINKRPTRLFATDALSEIEKKSVSLDAPFKITIKGTLAPAKDGKTIVLTNAKAVAAPGAQAGDPEMQKFAQKAVLAFADSGWFGYLSKVVDRKDIVIILEQTDQGVAAHVVAEQANPYKADQAQSGLNGLLAIASAGTNDTDVKAFLQAAKAGSDGKTFFIDFQLPKQTFTEMVQRKLAEQKSQPAPTPGQPDSSTGAGRFDNNTASKIN